MTSILLPEDADYLVQAMTRECADLPYAARVGIAAVILNRVEDERYPDTAAAVLAAWETPAFSAPPDETEYRLCLDAYKAAADGADPTAGALHFTTYEKEIAIDPTFPRYTAVIGSTVFW
ncbi:MAG: cell wall hydrolase [Eubacteriales bacterium]